MLNQKDLVKELIVQEKEKAWLVKKVLNDKECNFIKNYFFMKKRVLDFRLANKVSSIFQEKKYGWGHYGDDQCTSTTYCNYGDILNDLYLPEVVNVLSDIFLSNNFDNITVLRWSCFGFR